MKCGYKCCRKDLPGLYGEPGVSLSRSDNNTLICSSCGIAEAFVSEVLPRKFDPDFKLAKVKIIT